MTRCARCNGSLVQQHTIDGPVLGCLACGREYPMTTSNDVGTPVPASNRLQESITRAQPQPPLSFADAGRRELAAVLKRITEVDTLRAEAERIHRALTIYGCADLAPLPWKNARGGTQAIRKPGQPRRLAPDGTTCRFCGYLFTSVADYHGVTGGYGWRCRDRTACDARRVEVSK